MIYVDKISEEKKNCFWYFNTLIAEEVSDDGKIELYAVGDIEVYLPLILNEDEIALFKGNNAIAQAEKLGYTDIDIALLHAGNQFNLTNWFQYKYILDDISVYLDTVFDYDEAVEGIITYL